MIGISLARVLGTTIRTPFDVLKVRLQVQGSNNYDFTYSHELGSLKSGIQYKNSLQAIRSLWKTEGKSDICVICKQSKELKALLALSQLHSYETLLLLSCILVSTKFSNRLKPSFSITVQVYHHYKHGITL